MAGEGFHGVENVTVTALKYLQPDVSVVRMGFIIRSYFTLFYYLY
jgi:hypothetical protein